MNSNGSAAIGRIAQWAIMVLGVLFTIMIFTGSETGIDGGLWVTYIAFGVAAVSTVVFSLRGLSKKSLIGIGAFVVLLGLAYALSDGSTQPEWRISESTSKWIGAGLILMYISLFGAIAAIIYGEVTRMLK
jgi:hypothetical protein